MEMIGRNASAVSETEHREEYIILLTLKYVTAVLEKCLKNDWESGHWDGLLVFHVFGPGVNLCSIYTFSAAKLSAEGRFGGPRD